MRKEKHKRNSGEVGRIQNNGNGKPKSAKKSAEVSLVQAGTVNLPQTINTLPRCTYLMPKKSPPTRTYSANPLPLVRPGHLRCDSFTSSTAPVSDDGFSNGCTTKWKQPYHLNGGSSKYEFTTDDTLSCANNTLAAFNPVSKYDQDIESDTCRRESSRRCNVKTMPTFNKDNRFKTMPLRRIPSVIKVIEPTENKAVKSRSQFGTLPSSNVCRPNHRGLITSHSTHLVPKINGSSITNLDPTALPSYDMVSQIAMTQTLHTDDNAATHTSPLFHTMESSCSKMPLLISPINESSNCNFDGQKLKRENGEFSSNCSPQMGTHSNV